MTIGRGRRARILVVTPIYPTADRPEAGAFVRRRVLALRESGATVDVLSFSSYRRAGAVRYLRLLVRTLAPRPRPDGVEGHVLLWAGLFALIAARIHRVPLLIYAHGLDVRVTAQRSPLHRALGRLVARSAGEVVTNSSATAAWVARLGRAAEIVSPGVDLGLFRPADRATCRAALGLPTNRLVALYVGTFSGGKAPDVLAEALVRSPGWLGVFVGSGELEATIRERVPSAILPGVVEPDVVPMWLASADVVVVPSREEALGLAAVEALACGIPVIASRTGGLVDVVSDGRTGVLVPAGDPDAVARALERLTDAKVRNAMSAAARTSVREHDIRRSTARMAEIWARLGVAISPEA
jgi:glycosyltransferase involved in cell wall biosynthesis